MSDADMTRGREPAFVDEHQLHVGETEFYCAFPLHDAPDGMLQVMKDRPLVERYLALSRTHRPKVIVELGIRRGGSTALLAELNTPDKILAFEIATAPAAQLSDYVQQRGLSDKVRTFYGIDQADRERLSTILADELGSRPIDLVVDDASHLYVETVSSFETLFPRLGPGGLFVIEDWNADHLIDDLIMHALQQATPAERERIQGELEARKAADAALKDPGWAPLTRLAMELVIARSSSGDAIREVTIDEHWIQVRRGADPLDPQTFRLTDLVHDHFGFAASTP